MMTSSYPISYAAVLEGHGGKDGMMTSSTESGSDENSEDEDWYEKEESDEEQDESVPVGLSIVEKKFGDYECPTLVLTEEEERRIRRPWKKGIIIKLLGRKIGFKALENRLRQMWVKRGILNIIDLGNDFFLVTLSSIEDHLFVLTGGPWLIYDHYLIVREWCPNFDPRCAAIDNAAVWVRLSGLPIEYYDAKVLKFLGNRIGTTVKVDKTTLMQERGKYARLCVEVDLQMPLLAFFEIKGRNYNIEYEGLHLFCLHCGKFGHYKEACPEKPRMEEQSTDPEIIEAESSNMGARRNETARNRETGPWVVVQKPRRQRKALLGAAATRSGYDGTPSYAAGITGSRFASLGEEEIEAPITHPPTEDMMAEKELNVIPIIARNRKVAKSKPLITRNNEVAFDTSKQQEVQKEGTRDGLALDIQKSSATNKGLVEGETLVKGGGTDGMEGNDYVGSKFENLKGGSFSNPRGVASSVSFSKELVKGSGTDGMEGNDYVGSNFQNLKGGFFSNPGGVASSVHFSKELVNDTEGIDQPNANCGADSIVELNQGVIAGNFFKRSERVSTSHKEGQHVDICTKQHEEKNKDGQQGASRRVKESTKRTPLNVEVAGTVSFNGIIGKKGGKYEVEHQKRENTVDHLMKHVPSRGDHVSSSENAQGKTQSFVHGINSRTVATGLCGASALRKDIRKASFGRVVTNLQDNTNKIHDVSQGSSSTSNWLLVGLNPK